MQIVTEQSDSFVSKAMKFTQRKPIFFVALIAIIMTISSYDEVKAIASIYYLADTFALLNQTLAVGL